jgi:hypothetical protein
LERDIQMGGRGNSMMRGSLNEAEKIKDDEE